MTSDPDAPDERSPASEAPASPPSPQDRQDREQEAGDFITRHVLEKDSVFFEG
jgi:hypothetical protein